MPQRYVDAILRYLSRPGLFSNGDKRDKRPLTTRSLARRMGVGDKFSENYGAFREAVKRLRESGRIVLGERDALMLPAIPDRLVGFFRANRKGFGFVVPETPNAHGDLYVPPEGTGGAMTGDLVAARVKKRGHRAGKMLYAGQIVEILQRGNNRFVGALERTEDTWFVLPDGQQMATPIVVRDISSASPPPGTKVVVEIVRYPEPGDLPVGVIVETLGEKGDLEVETLSVIRAHGLSDEFSADALAEGRRAVDVFDKNDPDAADGREDLTALTVVTIDPPDARDFDDAISLTRNRDGKVTLGVHIADVSHFVREGGALDGDARSRTTSAYFPRRVVPMLPEIISNGVCSLQEGQVRFTKSVFLVYDGGANVVATRFAETTIRSTKRLTYAEAQEICDGRRGGDTDPRIAKMLKDLADLSRRIEARRRKAGMLQLDLPEVELVFDESHRLVDAVPSDDSYTHTMIEMFMVEANEAVAALFNRLGRACIRRIHPEPDPSRAEQLAAFVRACGRRLPRDMTRRDMQNLLDAVRGKPDSFPVNLALLRTFQQAEYSPLQIGHFALASEHYCHFTSPIRRYPDLTVHRLLAEHCRGSLPDRPPEDIAELTKLGEHCTAGARRAEAAEQELREALILQLLSERIGESFRGVITGVTNFGIFVQSPKYLVDGLVRLEDLGDDWWEVSGRYGQVKGERSGKTYRIGVTLEVRIAAVDVGRRQLNLVPEAESGREKRGAAQKKRKKPSPKPGKKAQIPVKRDSGTSKSSRKRKR